MQTKEKIAIHHKHGLLGISKTKTGTNDESICVYPYARHRTG